MRLASPINVHTQRGRGRERDLVGAIIVNGASVLSIRDAGSPAQHNHMDARALRDRKMAARKRGDQRPLTMANVDEHTVGSKSIEVVRQMCSKLSHFISVSREHLLPCCLRQICPRPLHSPTGTAVSERHCGVCIHSICTWEAIYHSRYMQFFARLTAVLFHSA